MAESTIPAPELSEVAVAALAIARAELRIERLLDIYWHTGPITGTDDQERRGGYDEAQPDRIHLSAALTDPAEVVEVVRHETCHAAGFTAARMGLLPAENACGYFAVGVLPMWVNGKAHLPAGPHLAPSDWPAYLSPEILRNAPPGEGLIAGKWSH